MSNTIYKISGMLSGKRLPSYASNYLVSHQDQSGALQAPDTEGRTDSGQSFDLWRWTI